MGKQGVVLEHQAEASLVDGHTQHGFAVPSDLSAIGFFEAGDSPEHRGFARAGWSHQDMDRSIVNREVGTVECG